jgi:HEAT repeat protein
MPNADLPTTHEAIRELVAREDAAALELLTDVAASGDPFLRRTAVEAIGNHPQAGSVHAVILTALTDPSEYVVRTACNVVAKCGIFEAHDRLLSHLASPSGSTRESALHALCAIWHDSDFSMVFRIYQRDDEIRVRRKAASVLRATVSSETWRRLFDVFSVDELARHRQWACELAEAFSGIEMMPLLSKLTCDPDGHVRKAASRAVETISARMG